MNKSIEIESEKPKLSHRESRERLAEIIGMISNDQDRHESTITQGIRRGTIRYVPVTGEGEVLGELHITLQKRGKKTDKIFEITDEGQAKYFLGFQDGVDQKRRQP